MESIVPLIIYVGVPLAGLLIFRKTFENVEDNAVYFISLINTAHFGGWILILLTGAFWYWSGMAALGFFYLIFIAPLLSIGFAYWLLKHKAGLEHYEYALISSTIYFAFILLFITAILLKSRSV